MALLPHIALLSQTVPNPADELDPHIADEPHMADDPHIAEFDETNCDDPHTAALPHMAELFHTAEGSDVRNTLPELAS